MALYETTFVLRQDISAQDVEKVTEGFTKLVKDSGGKVVKQEYWGLRNLAYKIKKNRKGHYVFLGIEAGGDIVKELGRRYGLNEDIIRSLTVRVEKLEKGPTALMRDAASN